MITVEIFRTNVKNKRKANLLLKTLRLNIPACHFNFDLDDCDRILRAQTEGCAIETNRIIEVVNAHAAEICLIED